METRKRTLQLTMTLTVTEHYDPEKDAEESERYQKFYWEENHCIQNELKTFADRLKEDSDNGFCEICTFTDIKMLPLDSDIEGYDISDAFNLNSKN